MSVAEPYLFATLTLCAWWGAWSLADVYLLKYSPWSEAGALLGSALVAFALVCVSKWRARAAATRGRSGELLDCRKGARAFVRAQGATRTYTRADGEEEARGGGKEGSVAAGGTV